MSCPTSLIYPNQGGEKEAYVGDPPFHMDRRLESLWALLLTYSLSGTVPLGEVLMGELLLAYGVGREGATEGLRCLVVRRGEGRGTWLA